MKWYILNGVSREHLHHMVAFINNHYITRSYFRKWSLGVLHQISSILTMFMLITI